MRMILSIQPWTGATFLRRGFPLLVLLIAAVVLSGCQPSIEVEEPMSPLARPTVVPEDRGVAILGVDFDPPLEAGQLLANGGVTLLVAVENQGQQAEPTVRVTARLYDPQSPRAADLANETITVRGLAPGELRVVRFTQVTDLPVRMRYKLTVEASTLPGEHQLDDNRRVYDILVRAAE